MKVVTIVGARPQFIKASAVSAALREHPSEIEEVVVHTGQHYDTSMSGIFFSELGMAQPKYDLGVGSGKHGEQTGKMLAAVEGVLLQERPDVLLVYGDTNSTLAGALAGAKLCIPIAHVEAGLRSFNRRMPEEVNRVLTDHLAEILFAPTTAACQNLRNEGISAENVHLVGDVMFDVALKMGAKAVAQSTILEQLALDVRGFVLCTIHRAENTDSPTRLRQVLTALNELSRDMPVVFPVHPRTWKVLQSEALGKLIAPGVRLTEPLGYLDMVMLERSAALVATDSGGVQKEAFFHRVPCVTLREETEWVELIESGWNRLAPPNDGREVGKVLRAAIGSRGRECKPYGDGRASRQIVEILLRRLSVHPELETLAGLAG